MHENALVTQTSLRLAVGAYSALPDGIAELRTDS